MKAKYGILCGSRTGSTHLSELLTSTNRCGKPKEYFNADLSNYFKSIFNADDNNYKHKIINKTKTENDVFGVKVVGLEQLKTLLDSDIQITHWIYLYRDDKILQAISKYIAWKTGFYHKNKNYKEELVEFSYDNIMWFLNQITEEEKKFEDFLSDKNFMSVIYEDDIEEYPDQTVISILNFLNISTDDLPELKSNQTIFRNEQNYKMKEQFLNYNK